jgi:heme oxygenase
VDNRHVITSLAQRLRTETRDLHTEVERSPLMHALLRGELKLGAYCMLLRNFHAIYVALEAALTRHATEASLVPLCIPALFRSDALARDLSDLYGAAWERTIVLQPATGMYVAQLKHLQETDPALLLAHAYVRYLGDLSGGQLLKRIVAKNLGLAAGSGTGTGTAFYDFGDADTTQGLIRQFRAGLENIPVDQTRIDAIVAEAKRAFELHRSLFQQLALAGGIAEAGDGNA